MAVAEYLEIFLVSIKTTTMMKINAAKTLKQIFGCILMRFTMDTFTIYPYSDKLSVCHPHPQQSFFVK